MATGTISSIGLGSGLDIKSIVSQLVALEKQPLATLQVKEATTTTNISTVAQIKSLVSTLDTAVGKLSSVTGWNAVSATSSDSSVSVSAIGGTQPTNFDVQVQQVAQSRSATSMSFARGAFVGAGTLKFTTGSSTTSITVGATDTLADVASKINGSTAGVYATILTDPTTGQQRLMLKGKTTGADNAFSISVTDSDGNNTDGSGLSRLADKVATKQSGAYTAGAVIGGSGTIAVNGTSVSVDSTDTLSDIAGKINTALGTTTATVTTDANGKEHLALTGTVAGPAGVVSVKADDGASPALTQLVSGMTTSSDSWTENAVAQDAKATINGIAVSSSSNTFDNVVAGITLTVNSVTASGVTATVGVTQNTSAMKDNIKAFVDAYNAVNDLLSELTAYDSASGTGGAFQGDSTIISLKRMLTTAMQTVSTANGPLASYTTWNSLGITAAQGGDLSIDDTKLDTALSDPAAMKKLFSNAGTGNAQGLATVFKSLTSALLGSAGLIQTKSDSLSTQLKSIQSDEDAVNTRASNLEDQLNAKYSALDATMSTLNSTATYLTQQLAQWNKSS